MPYLINLENVQKQPGAYSGNWGAQCVALAQLGPPAPGSATPPNTSLWRKGIWVRAAAPGEIKKGTVIATFTAAGRYPTGSEGNRHTALYVSHDSNGVTVLDQWVDKPTPSERTLPFVGYHTGRRVDKGDHYWVVELEEEIPAGMTGVDQQTLGD